MGSIARQYGPALLAARGSSVTAGQQRVLTALATCRTAALGGHVDECTACGWRRPSYNSCRDRHCPNCQGAARFAWLEARRQDLLPIGYFHVVFTLPSAVASLAHAHPRLIYDLLFAAAADTLRQVAADPRHLGARVGVLAVLHTWGQNLHLHPHLHCVVTGGGLSPDCSAWISSAQKFLLPVRVLSAVFRGKFLAQLRAARDRGELPLSGSLAKWQRPERFAQLLRGLYRRKWIVYAKPPFGGPEQVLKYLARYTHRVAISNQRILHVADGNVTFRWKDYADGDRQKQLTLSATEFLRRFLQHVLPKGFVRIRQYGLLANRNRAELLATCRRLLGALPPPAPADQDEASRGEPPVATNEPAGTCPHCCQATAWRRADLGPRPSLWQLALTYWNCNSS